MIFQSRSLRTLTKHIAAQGSKAQPCPKQHIAYATRLVATVHEALLLQRPEPWYRQPDSPVTGWLLMRTDFHAEPGVRPGARGAETYLGARAIYLTTRPHRIERVLMVPDSDPDGRDLVVAAVGRTSVPSLLHKDPTAYQELVDGAAVTAEQFGLECILPDPPF